MLMPVQRQVHTGNWTGHWLQHNLTTGWNSMMIDDPIEMAVNCWHTVPYASAGWRQVPVVNCYWLIATCQSTALVNCHWLIAMLWWSIDWQFVTLTSSNWSAIWPQLSTGHWPHPKIFIFNASMLAFSRSWQYWYICTGISDNQQCYIKNWSHDIQTSF